MLTKGRKNVVFNNTKIILSIKNSEPLGRNISEISLDTGINRGTVTRRCTQLAKNRFLTNKDHKHGRYHITEKVYSDPELQASIFADESIRGIFYGFTNHLPLDNEISKYFQESLQLEDKFWTSLESNLSDNLYEEKYILQNFVVRVGLQVTYAMIEAVRKNELRLALGKNEIGQVNIELKGIENDSLTRIWVKKAISPLVIFREFVKLPIIRRGRAIPRDMPAYEDKELLNEIQKYRRNPFNPDNPSIYELDKENMNKITEAFKELWPATYQGFEAIKTKLPKLVESTYDTRNEFEKLDSEKNITEKLKTELAKKTKTPVSESFRMLFNSVDKPQHKQYNRKRKPSNRI